MINVLNTYRKLKNSIDLDFILDGLQHYFPLEVNSEDELSSISGVDSSITYDDNNDFQNTADFTLNTATEINLGHESSFSFGNGTIDQDFTIMLRFALDSAPFQEFLLGKRNATTDKEYQLSYVGNSLRWRQFDQSSGGTRDLIHVHNPDLNQFYLLHITCISGVLKMYLDGVFTNDTQLDSGSYTAMEQSVSELILGKYSVNNSFTLDGFLGEFAKWNRGLSNSEISIIKNRYEQNLSLLSGIDIPVTSSYLLDTYGSASGAYSLRYLSTLFVGNDVIEVRRSSDDTTQSFTPSEISDGTLTTFTGVGDGFISKWYDQSGNVNDAENPTLSQQPRIVSSGVLETKDGFPSVYFNGTQPNFLVIPTLTNTHAFTVHAATSYNNIVDALLGSSVNNAGLYAGGTFGSVTGIGMSDANTNPTLYSTIEDTNMHLTNAKFGGTALLRVDGSDQASGTLNASTINRIGVRGSSFAFSGYFQEVVIWPTDQSSNSVGIESNINSHYSIY